MCVFHDQFLYFVVTNEDKTEKSLKEKQAKLFGKYNLSETQLGTLAVWRETYGNRDNCRARLHMKKRITEKLDPVGSTVRYEMMKLCTGSV